MEEYKEIVTKAVVGKGKKTFKNDYEMFVESSVNTVLGCWVINHVYSAKNDNGFIVITGSFDVNIWYSFENNTKTSVAVKKENYIEKVKVKLKDDIPLTNQYEIIIRALHNPSCTNIKEEDHVIKYVIEKELGIEIVGDTKVRIAILNEADDYDIIEDNFDNTSKLKNSLDSIDKEVTEEYLKRE
ncbi:MAG: outer spore coat protein CotE [Bacilli bacterium]